MTAKASGRPQVRRSAKKRGEVRMEWSIARWDATVSGLRVSVESTLRADVWVWEVHAGPSGYAKTRDAAMRQAERAARKLGCSCPCDECVRNVVRP